METAKFRFRDPKQLGGQQRSSWANVDPSKCLECHKDKASGKYMHTAVSMGCTVCHTVANIKGSTYVSLSSPADQLCVTCHKLSTDPVQHPSLQGGQLRLLPLSPRQQFSGASLRLAAGRLYGLPRQGSHLAEI